MIVWFITIPVENMFVYYVLAFRIKEFSACASCVGSFHRLRYAVADLYFDLHL